MEWLFLTDDAVIDELRGRCRRERLAQNLSQADLATRAGLNRETVRRFEADEYSPTLASFVAILRALGGLEALAAVLPERPLDPLNPTATDRKRARSGREAPQGEWTWGEPQ